MARAAKGPYKTDIIMIMFLRFFLVLGLVTPLPTMAAAANSRLDAMLRRLEPDTRFEQVCDIALMARIQADPSEYHPDRVVGGALSPPRHAGNKLLGAGAAFRSGGRWYRLTFECTTTPDHMRVLTLHYRVGEPIPEESWSDLGLWR